MRREDIFMDIIGELDDKYIELAMPRPRRSSFAAATGSAAVVQSVGASGEVSKKDLRIYWITRALGMAAVTVLVFGAVFLLWKNWDKITVRDPDTPPVVTTETTTVTDPSVITTDIDDGGKTNAPTVTFNEMKNMISYNGKTLSLPCTCDDILALDDRLYVDYSSESYKGSSYSFMIDGEFICSLTIAVGGTDIDIPEGKQLVTFGIRSGENFSLFGGKIKHGTTLDEVKSLLGEPMHNDIYPDYNYEFTSGGESISINDMRFDDDGKLIQMPDITYIGESTVDRFEQITDTSMPDLITGYYDDDSYFNFEFPWKLELRGIPIELMRLVDESETDKWFESVNTLNSGTPYRINRGYNLYSYITAVGLSWEDAAPILERDFSADEISAMASENTELITKNSASEFTIVIGDCAYSPKWLYYHTADNYASVGITPGMVGEMIPQYQKLELPDEMWKAFRKKLNLFAYGDEDHSIHEYSFTKNAEPFGDHAFEILENVFYGEWERISDHDTFEKTLSFTYSKDPFRYESVRPIDIIETNEIYIIIFNNTGVATCYVIEKNDPDVMYLTEYENSVTGNDLVEFDDTTTPRYSSRKAAKPEIKSGELSVLGLKKLFNIYGSKFEESFTDLLAKDKSEGVDFDGRKLYPTGKDIYRSGEPPMYLCTLNDDEVDILMPYYYVDEDGGEDVVYLTETEVYAVVSFMRNYKGD